MPHSPLRHPDQPSGASGTPALGAARDAGSLPDPPKRSLSPYRIAGAVTALLVVAGAVTALGVRRAYSHAAAPVTPLFAPYVDVTLTPSYAFQDATTNPARRVVLALVVASPSAPCVPTWGGAYTLNQAALSLDLDRRITLARSEGGDVMVSFGGAANTELAADCQSPAALRAAYTAVIGRYHATTIDFDIEGAALADQAANARRAAALAAIQRRRSRSGTLAVWLTLPVAPTGLTADGLRAVRQTLTAGVRVAGVNVMAMDFGGSRPPHQPMITTVEQAWSATHRQIASLTSALRRVQPTARLTNGVGITVMIGQNDSPDEQFRPADAQQLAHFAAAHRIPRISFWSLNRDTPCPGTYQGVSVLSNLCSGVGQSPLAFTDAFLRVATGPRSAFVRESDATTNSVPVDNPATSPYPVWNPLGAYPSSYKVVWHRQVYEAKWYSEGQSPDSPQAAGAASSWTLIGPVRPGDHLETILTVASAHYPLWSPSTAYTAADRVTYGGEPYEAKWYTTDDTPDLALANPSLSPWRALFTIPGEPR
jgi:chitinase